MTLHTRKTRLPYGYTVTFTASMPVEGKITEQNIYWSPGFPRIESRKARRKFHTAYTKARDEFVREIATIRQRHE